VVNKKTNSTHIAPYMVLTLAVIAGSSAGTLIRLCPAPAFIIGFYRLLIAGIFMLGGAWYKNRSLSLRIPREDIPYSLLAGLFLGLHFATWITCLGYTTISSATILVNTQPLFVTFLGWIFLKEKVEKWDIIGLALAFLGAVIISGGDLKLSGKEFMGDMLALVSGFFAAIYFLFGRKTRPRVELNNYMSIVYGAAAFFLGTLAVIAGNPFAPYSSSVWFWIAMMVIFPTLMGHSLLNWSLKYISAHKVGLALYVEPVLASVLAYLVFNQVPHMETYIGGVLILTGVMLSMGKGKADEHPDEVEPIE